MNQFLNDLKRLATLFDDCRRFEISKPFLIEPIMCILKYAICVLTMNGYRKHRGLKRYYKNLAVENDLQHHNWLEFDGYGYRHLHFDIRGYGNNSFRRRKPHLDKLFRHFDLLVEETNILKVEFQLYAMLLDYKSGSDALFLHSPEPNYRQFPFKISELKTITTLTNAALNDYISQLIGYEKMYGREGGEAFCLLFKKNIGVHF